MLVVTGANGQLGRLVVDHLLAKVPADRVGVGVRDPDKARDLADRGVRVVRSDFGEPATLDRAFAGAERILIVSTDELGPGRVRAHRAALDAVARSGARHLAYTSAVDPDPGSPFFAAADHAATEAAIRSAGIPFTILRNTFYAEIVPRLIGDAASSGLLIGPEDGPIAYAARADLAEAAASILADGGHAGESPELTGDAALDLAGVAGLLADRLGRPIERRVVPDDEYRAALVARGVPEVFADLTLGIFRASREGRYARVDPALGRLLGRPPRSLGDVLAPAGPPPVA